ncbi:MAG: hypothetical protein HY092_02875 [Candidatus Kerfeldbacteria bacterium]|nr:hypothetical protein [Candidatus Kerfeldbacteria bacterium]
MFDAPTSMPPSTNPLNPPLSPTPPAPPTPMGPPSSNLPPQQPHVYTMPEKFRSVGNTPSGGSGKTKKLLIILVVLLVIGGLGVAGLFVFRNVLNNKNVSTTNVANRSNVNNIQNANILNLNNQANTNVSNLNATTNTNVNANTNSNTNVSTTMKPLPSSTDSDSDGLTDTEEAVYGTDPAKADTDGDGFIDGKKVQANGTIIGELYNGYNPKGPGTLEASGLVKRVANDTNVYSVLVPTPWTTVADASGGLMITPSQSTGEFFRAQINDNPNHQTPQQWYQSANPTANVAALNTVAVNGLEGIYSEDGSTVYLFKDTKVYSIQYNTGSLSQVNYWTTFDMITRSFKLVASS